MQHEIIQLIAEGHDNFITLIVNRSIKQAIVVDPAWDADGISEVIKDEDLELVAILITHSHDDHVNAVKQLYQEGITLFITAEDFDLWPDCPKDAVFIENGDEIQFGSESIQVISTPGHTPGSCCYLIGNDLITGDTLFIYGCGRADFAHSDIDALYHSLQKIKALSPLCRLWVGHNYSICEESTLAEQLQGNPFLMIDNQADFIRYRSNIASKTRKIPYGPISQSELNQVLDEYSV